MTKKSRFSLERHKQAGRDLYRIRNQLMHFWVEVQHAYPQSVKAYRLAYKAFRAVNDLRCALDNELFREHAAYSDDVLLKVYYGRPGEDADQLEAHGVGQDADATRTR